MLKSSFRTNFKNSDIKATFTSSVKNVFTYTAFIRGVAYKIEVQDYRTEFLPTMPLREFIDAEYLNIKRI